MTVGELVAHPLVAAGILHAPGRSLEAGLDWLVYAERLEAIGESEAESVALAPASLLLEPDAASELGRLESLGVRLFLGASDAGPVPGSSAGGHPGAGFGFPEGLGAAIALLPPGRGYREVSWALRGEACPGLPSEAAAPAPASTPSALLERIAMASGDSLSAVFAPAAVSEPLDGRELLAAVEAYLRHGRNAVAAAAELGVHRHTVHARVGRYESLTGLSLDDHETGTLASLAFSLGARVAKGG